MGGVARRSRDDDLLGATSDMGLSLSGGGEDTGGLAHVRGADLSPRNVGRVALREELDGALLSALLSDDEAVGCLVGLDGSGVLSVDGIVLEHVTGVVEGKEGVVDGDGGDITLVLEGGSAYETTDAAESVYSNLDSHVWYFLI